MYVYLTHYNVDIHLLPLRPGFVWRAVCVGFVTDKIYLWSCDVLLTVHLSIFILVISQLDAQNFVLQ